MSEQQELVECGVRFDQLSLNRSHPLQNNLYSKLICSINESPQAAKILMDLGGCVTITVLGISYKNSNLENTLLLAVDAAFHARWTFLCLSANSHC